MQVQMLMLPLVVLAYMMKMTDPLLTSTSMLLALSDIRWRLENPSLEDEPWDIRLK